MIDIKKQYEETKKLAKSLMRSGNLKEYILKLEKLNELQLKLAA